MFFSYHDDCLYDTQDELVEKLSKIMTKPEKFVINRQGLSSNHPCHSKMDKSYLIKSVFALTVNHTGARHDQARLPGL